MGVSEALVPVCSKSSFNFTLLFALQKKAEAAHRILEGLGPQVELVSWWLGWAGSRVEEWGLAAGVGWGKEEWEGGGGSHVLPSAVPRGRQEATPPDKDADR